MSPRFLHYPSPRKGPSVSYKNENQSIPAFRGRPLVLGAAIIQSFSFVQSILWKGAALNIVRDIKDLDAYTPRFDPSVVPILDDENGAFSNSPELPYSTKRRNDDGTGFYTSADYHARYVTGELTPSAVIEALLPLIRRDTQPPGKHSTAFLESQVDAIRAAAEASTRRYKSGKPIGPLDGVPIAVKDEVHLKGYKRMLGSKLDFKGQIDETSWCVKKWEEAGAIIVGKTTMHELGLDTTNNNPNYGTPKNPFNPKYYCGGSSGGSGYALAAGLVPIALGADGGGSIRIPASYCGIWGLKPTHGRVSASPTPGLANTVGVYGPMACSIDDLALAYRIMATPAPAVEDSLSALFPDPLASIPSTSAVAARRKIIGLVRPWIDRAEPSVRAIFDAALGHYQHQQGYTIIDIDIPYLPEGQRAHSLTILGEISAGVDRSQIHDLTPHSKLLLSVGGNMATAQDYLASQKMRHLLMCHLAHLFIQYPGLVIFSPTCPDPGSKIQCPADLSYGVADGKASVRSMEYTWLANLTGCPSISCPAGYDSDSGIPIGLMGMSEWGSEEALFDFARDGEGVLDLNIVTKADSNATGTGKGLRTPSGDGSQWVDLISTC